MAEEIARERAHVLGHALDEHRRLDLRASVIRPYTERLLWDAGIGPGMRVLDAGCGTGDVTLLTADLVGPGGEVVGVDRSAVALATATSRSAGRRLRQVRFVEGDFMQATLAGPFDAVVGRFVLFRLADPAGAIRALAALLRPGGVLAFQELVVPNAILATRPRPLLARTTDQLIHSLVRAGFNVDLGLRLPILFRAAGYPTPDFRLDGVINHRPDPTFMRWYADAARAIIAGGERSSADDRQLDLLAEQLLAEQDELGGVVCPLLLGGAFAHVPLE